jgi:hypothetical protein
MRVAQSERQGSTRPPASRLPASHCQREEPRAFHGAARATLFAMRTSAHWSQAASSAQAMPAPTLATASIQAAPVLGRAKKCVFRLRQ